ncbi:spore coat protein [Halobacillus yeomjeoni]|uniref:Spore coat protein n=1 Tax=Halobacillus yeomjeoni TaxID=311194 RepID=A0A931MW18_9BACI|nr:spore coat protein [Halobacillus yeomjeoni]MBH0230971.1 spore coat protein [Halobacillus yeomjeoni]
MKEKQNPGNDTPPPVINHGGHEIFDAHEVITSVISFLDHQKMYASYVQDQELMTLLNRQQQFTAQLYNTIVESFSSGKDPSVPTRAYKMQQNNRVTYGVTPSEPKKPIQSLDEITDEKVSAYLLGEMKALASLFTMTSLEMTNPVLRRITADSVPNLIEMSYELFLYQNKHGFYQVPKLKEQDMSRMLHSYSQVSEEPPLQ